MFQQIINRIKRRYHPLNTVTVSKSALLHNYQYLTEHSSMKIAVLPIGYNDGIDRRVSNKGGVMVHETLCQILGRVSMNIIVIDVTEVADIKVGNKVIVYSNNPAKENSISEVAAMFSTIAYELLVHLHPSTKRIVVD